MVKELPPQLSLSLWAVDLDPASLRAQLAPGFSPAAEWDASTWGDVWWLTKCYVTLLWWNKKQKCIHEKRNGESVLIKEYHDVKFTNYFTLNRYQFKEMYDLIKMKLTNKDAKLQGPKNQGKTFQIILMACINLANTHVYLLTILPFWTTKQIWTTKTTANLRRKLRKKEYGPQCHHEQKLCQILCTLKCTGPICLLVLKNSSSVTCFSFRGWPYRERLCNISD